MSQVNTLHQTAYFEKPDLTTRHPSWNFIANVLFTTVFASLLHEVVVDIVFCHKAPEPCHDHSTGYWIVHYVSDSEIMAVLRSIPGQ